MTSVSEIVRPYFVYGTLRPGFGNDRIWINAGGRVELDGIASVRGFRMTAGGIPFAIPSDDRADTIVGAIVHPPRLDLDLCYELRQRLDGLEGYPHLYDRKVVEVGPTGAEAWIYYRSEPISDTPFLPSPADYAAPVRSWRRPVRSWRRPDAQEISPIT
jgi:gamma-glutamylcyclotransferase (GGCT)/AIG2-like uncharacterized protein YtfP